MATTKERVMSEGPEAAKPHGKIIPPAKRGFAGKVSDHECSLPDRAEVEREGYQNGTQFQCTDVVDGKPHNKIWTLQLPKPMAWRPARPKRKPQGAGA